MRYVFDYIAVFEIRHLLFFVYQNVAAHIFLRFIRPFENDHRTVIDVTDFGYSVVVFNESTYADLLISRFRIVQESEIIFRSFIRYSEINHRKYNA